MGKRFSSLLIVASGALTVLSACDSNGSNPDNGDNPPVPMTKIDYSVVGTYRTCQITYADEGGSDVALGEVAIDWADSVKVPQSQQFRARLSATCADVEREGKATLAIAVDGEERVSDTVIGFGASNTVEFLVMPR